MSFPSLSKSLLRRISPAPFLLAVATYGASVNSPSGLSLRVNEKTGDYVLSLKQPAWRFAGSVHTPLRKAATESGRDASGPYHQISFEWLAEKTPMSGSIRIYDANAVAVFSQTCGAALEVPPAPFPSFTTVPDKLHVFSYGHREFAPPRFTSTNICTPWLLFDDSANAFIISPASHFMVASMIGDGRTQVASGFNENLRNLPKGFTQETLIAAGAGINKTWNTWGSALVSMQGTTRPPNDADTVLKYLGYWTDNGASYYYNYDLEKGYAATLQELVERYRSEQIPIRYLQLDSWWYYKTTTDANGTPGKPKKVAKLPEGEWNRYGGLLEYKAHTNLFPNGLDAFQKSIQLPLVTHNRWIDPASPYTTQYKISGIAAVDPKWWDHIADYLQTSGIITYEQDWLDRIYTYSPAFSSDLAAGEAFLDNMSRACREKGITVQYCMPYPCYFLQGSRYPNLTTIRTSGDRFNVNHWNDFLYTSRLAASMGIWPWADVYMSTERGNVLLSTLSAGPVGIGDLMGTETKTNLARAVRADGVIVKPDVSIVPLDRSYIADAKHQPAPLTANTYTDHDGTKTEYVFAFNRDGMPPAKVAFNLSDLGLNQPAYVHDYFANTGTRLGNSETYSAPLAQNGNAFYVVAPVGKSGIAFLGDADKFVGTGKQRIASLRDEKGKLTTTVLLAESEKSVVLHGYSATRPKATVIAGEDDDLQYDSTTGHFSIEVKADNATPIDKSTSDPVRRITVQFETPLK